MWDYFNTNPTFFSKDLRCSCKTYQHTLGNIYEKTTFNTYTDNHSKSIRSL